MAAPRTNSHADRRDLAGIRRWIGRLLVLGIVTSAIAEPVALADSPAKASAMLTTTSSRPTPLMPLHAFRMEGSPSLASAFGDARTLEASVHSFTATWNAMSALRNQFAASSHRLQRLLHQPRKRGARCPSSAIAGDYEQAREALREFEALGTTLEDRFRLLRRLHRLGDAAALTPAVQQAVARSRAVYRQALEDLREMSAVMNSELRAGLTRHRCSPTLASHAPPKDSSPKPARAPQTPGAQKTSPVRRILFVVDNRSCATETHVRVDGHELGTVAPGEARALRAPRGNRDLCLGDAAACKLASRTVFLHNGFRIARTCSTTSD